MPKSQILKCVNNKVNVASNGNNINNNANNGNNININNNI